MPIPFPRRPLGGFVPVLLALALALGAATWRFLAVERRGEPTSGTSSQHQPLQSRGQSFPRVAVPPAAEAATSTAEVPSDPPLDIEDLHRRHASGVTVDLEGTVQRHLRDELGHRHLQRFVVRLTSGHAVVVVRDLDRAARVPVKAGDAVQVRGRYVWSEDGGIVHGTHRGGAGHDEGGWIVHAGRTYR